MDLKQSTTATILLGPFVKTSDGVTSCTSLASTVTVYISKAGGTLAATTGTITHSTVQDGWYHVPLTAANANTVGRLQVVVHSSSEHLDVWDNYDVISGSAYDWNTGQWPKDVFAKLCSKSYKDSNEYKFYGSTSDYIFSLNIATTARTRTS